MTDVEMRLSKSSVAKESIGRGSPQIERDWPWNFRRLSPRINATTRYGVRREGSHRSSYSGRNGEFSTLNCCKRDGIKNKSDLVGLQCFSLDFRNLVRIIDKATSVLNVRNTERTLTWRNQSSLAANYQKPRTHKSRPPSATITTAPTIRRERSNGSGFNEQRPISGQTRRID